MSLSCTSEVVRTSIGRPEPREPAALIVIRLNRCLLRQFRREYGAIELR
jgi:hypothetical protein